MKKLFLLFIALITLASVSYASFPITENSTVLMTTNFEDPDEEEEKEDPAWWILIYILNFIIFVGGIFLLLRTWWRGWEKRKWWARKLVPWAILIAIPILLLLGLLMTGSGMGG